jgi:hypothetical protein
MRWVDGIGAILPTLIGSHASLIRGTGVLELAAVAVSIKHLVAAWNLLDRPLVGSWSRRLNGRRETN